MELTNMGNDGARRLVQQMKKRGYNKDVDLLLGTITAPPPALKLKLDNVSYELEKDDVIVSQHITNYSVPFTARITKAKHEEAPLGTLNDEYVDETGAYAEQKKSYNSLNFTFDAGTLSINNALKVGDRVLVAEFNEGQKYVILDRAVTY